MDFVTVASVVDVLAETWYWILVILGFTAVIFVHELGHFLAAKKVGIRVERFAIGFGPRLFGFKLGETDYCINLLPLGGYVKMTGQEDFRLEKGAVPDPRAFNNTSVGARALVISAGVIMNVIFAGIAFMIVFMCGKEFRAGQIGQVGFDSPAYGVLRPGDVPLKMDGDDVNDFTDVMLTPALHRGDAPMDVLVRRRDGNEEWVKIDPKAARGGALDGLRSIGVEADDTLVVVKPPDTPEDARHYAKLMGEALLRGELKGGDRIVRADGRPVQFASDLMNRVRETGGQPIAVTAERKVDGRTVEVEAVLDAELTGPSIREFQLLGAHPRLTVAAVVPGMPADGKLKPGDVLLRIEDVDYPQFTNGKPEDPERAPQMSEVIVRSRGREVTFVVERDGKPETVKIAPRVRWYRPGDVKVGIANGLYSKVAALGQVDDDSVLGRAGLPSGATVLAVAPATQPATQPARPATTRPSALSQRATQPDAPPMTWSQFYRAMRAAAGQRVVIAYRGRGGEFDAIEADVPPPGAWMTGVAFRPKFIAFEPMLKLYKTSNPLTAARMGAEKLGQFILQAYVTLDRLFRGTVSVKHLSGPVGIAYGSYKMARSGLIDLLYFLAMISANLAVINFLPLPIVDGGLMAFLGYEKLRRKPVSLKLMQWSQVVGIVLIVGLFVWVTWQDILRLILG